MRQDKTIILRFDIKGKELVYTAIKILFDNNDFITFVDKFGKTITYNKKYLISSEEVSK